MSNSVRWYFFAEKLKKKQKSHLKIDKTRTILRKKIFQVFQVDNKTNKMECKMKNIFLLGVACYELSME